MGAAQLYRRYF